MKWNRKLSTSKREQGIVTDKRQPLLVDGKYKNGEKPPVHGVNKGSFGKRKPYETFDPKVSNHERVMLAKKGGRG